MEPTGQKETTLSIQLTVSDCQNVVAFGNRATMQGKEADLWVGLKMKILSQVERHAERQAERSKGIFDDGEPALTAVPDNPGGTE